MDNAIFDYPPTNNFTESDNLLPDNAPEQANFAYHPNSDLSRHLIINHNIPCYNGMPRSINEYYYLDFFQITRMRILRLELFTFRSVVILLGFISVFVLVQKMITMLLALLLKKIYKN